MLSSSMIAFQSDPLDRLNVKTDTTLCLAHEAQKRNFKLFSYTPKLLTHNQNKTLAYGNFFKFNSENQLQKQQENEYLDLNEAKFVLIRQNPPFDLSYLTNTFILEHLSQETLVLNNPQSLRMMSEKLSILDFPHLIPPTLVTSDLQEIIHFLDSHKKSVVKPLFEYGGRGVLFLSAKDPNKYSLIELYLDRYPEGIMVQQFIPEVKEGDKRIILINGNPVGCFLRKPQINEIRSNLRVGAAAVPSILTQKDHEICEALSSSLKKLGLYLVGIDVIGSYLTEINVTSPTGFMTLKELYGIKAAELFWDGLGV